jgi:arylsulfatase
VPAETELTVRPEEIPAWDDMPDELKPVLARQMEVYAGFLEHTDHHLGRLVDALEDLDVLEGHAGLLHRRRQRRLRRGHDQRNIQRNVRLQRRRRTRDARVRRDSHRRIRHRTAYNHFAVGWAHAMDTPYQWTKQVASHWGGTRNGTIVHWPRGFTARGEVRTQFHHVIDVAPTVLEAAGLPHPTTVDGVDQRQIEGVSMALLLRRRIRS